MLRRLQIVKKHRFLQDISLFRQSEPPNISFGGYFIR